MERDPGTMVGRQGLLVSLETPMPKLTLDHWPAQEAHEMRFEESWNQHPVPHPWVGLKFTALQNQAPPTPAPAPSSAYPPCTSGIEVGGTIEDVGSDTGAAAQRPRHRGSRWAHIVTATTPRGCPSQGLGAVS